jgi:hypothetical protein
MRRTQLRETNFTLGKGVLFPCFWTEKCSKGATVQNTKLQDA